MPLFLYIFCLLNNVKTQKIIFQNKLDREKQREREREKERERGRQRERETKEGERVRKS